MFSYDTLWTISWQLGLIASVVALSIWLSAIVISWGKLPSPISILILLLSLSVLGAVVGYSTGLSREPAIGDVIPAVLGLIGGLSVYLFGLDTSKGVIGSVAALAFSLSLFAMIHLSSNERQSIELISHNNEFCSQYILARSQDMQKTKSQMLVKQFQTTPEVQKQKGETTDQIQLYSTIFSDEMYGKCYEAIYKRIVSDKPSIHKMAIGPEFFRPES